MKLQILVPHADTDTVVDTDANTRTDKVTDAETDGYSNRYI